VNKSDKIREHFRKHPDASVTQVAAKFEASLPMSYKLRKQVLDAASQPPAVEPEPSLSAWEKILQEVELGINLDDTLDERGKDYGKFKDGAALMQGMKRLLADHAAAHNKTFADDQWEALEMIVHKIGRIVNGDPDKVDSWVDIAGYASLVADRLNGIER
jgi:hypothetical protein